MQYLCIVQKTHFTPHRQFLLAEKTVACHTRGMAKNSLHHYLHKPVHPYFLAGITAVCIIAAIVIFTFFSRNNQSSFPSFQSNQEEPISLGNNTSLKPSNTISATSSLPITWHINSTIGLETYTNQYAPIVIAYPPYWGYRELKGDGVELAKNPSQGNATYNVYVSWNGSFGDPPLCSSHPMIQLKNEKLPACAYIDGNGLSRMQIDKKLHNMGIFIRTSTIHGVSDLQIRQILSTVSFTK